jgi:hypothetical protein
MQTGILKKDPRFSFPRQEQAAQTASALFD